MKKPRVYIMGGDDSGWALDEDLSLTRQALAPFVEEVSLEHADAVHSVWWEPLLKIPADQLAGKRVICHCSGEPARYLQIPAFAEARRRVSLWIAQSRQAARQFEATGTAHAYAPYAVDAALFHPLGRDHAEVRETAARWKIPLDRFLIGNFMRDTEGSDLRAPKLVKGPDVFLQIALNLTRRRLPVHCVLGGPRRHWLRAQLKEHGIAFTFAGEDIDRDDYRENRLDRREINLLYQVLDLALVCSRSEGGPRALLEAPSAGCPVFSSRVGIAEDVLPPEWIFDSPVDAAEMCAQAIAGTSAPRLAQTRERIRRHFVPEAARSAFERIYQDLKSIRCWAPPAGRSPRPRSLFQRLFHAVRGSAPRIGLWHAFVPPPYGGGNQFMLCLEKGLLKTGFRPVRNSLDADAIVLNSIHFDVERLSAARHAVPALHRIDGPIFLIRGAERDKDELCYSLNARFATATVLQSFWTYRKIVEFGYHPANPTVIVNAVDPDIFHRRGRIAPPIDRKIKLISSSWSGNTRKGGPLYSFLDRNLDFTRFEYTFVGNCSETLENIRTIPPVGSQQLADLLRSHDVFITASRNDPCSNAVIEALACGLPVLYLNQGGHPELVGFGGLPFEGEADVIGQLLKIADNYPMLSALAQPPSFDRMIAAYAAILRTIAVR